MSELNTSNSKPTLDDESLSASVTVPVIEEQLHVDTQTSVTGVVRINKKVTSETVKVEAPYTQENVNIERIFINEYVDEIPPAVRHEGNTMIISVLQEVLVKKTRLVEEVRITKSTEVFSNTESITLRTESVEVQHE